MIPGCVGNPDFTVLRKGRACARITMRCLTSRNGHCATLSLQSINCRKAVDARRSPAQVVQPGSFSHKTQAKKRKAEPSLVKLRSAPATLALAWKAFKVQITLFMENVVSTLGNIQMISRQHIELLKQKGNDATASETLFGS